MSEPDLAQDLPAFVDLVVRAAKRLDGVAAWEVRGDLVHDRRFVSDGKQFRASLMSELGGVSLRIFTADGGASFGMTTEATPEAAEALAQRVLAFARSSARKGVKAFAPGDATARRASYAPSVKRLPRDADLDEFRELLERAQAGAEAADTMRAGVRGTSSWASRERRVLFVDSHGSQVENATLLSSLLVHRLVRADGKTGDGFLYRSGERGLTDFEDEGGPEAIGAEASKRAHEYWEARAAPVGRMRVLTDNHLSGTLAHESFGHLTEYDLVASQWSVLRGRRGEAFAGEHVSVIDAPTVDEPIVQGVRVPLDEEGVRGKPVRLLDRGVLAAWMHVRGSAPESDDAPTGNGRSLDFRHPPIVRMRNTYFEPGDMSVEEALEELGTGVYLCGGRGGAPHSEGSFMFTAQRGYLVENGEIVAPIRSTSIYGNIFDFLHNIEGVTRDFRVFASVHGGCGKWSQSFLHVGMGGPHVLVREALVGGERPLHGMPGGDAA
ncbi:MAG TPA: TldD/PmbA family protein [Candidatus Thermoplasmatota archaeon]|nr:TldD/PmbA family protein [Candidatus Thermoplasmatota archaeon]